MPLIDRFIWKENIKQAEKCLPAAWLEVLNQARECPPASHSGSSVFQEATGPSPAQPDQAQGTKCTFHKRVERQGTPAGLVFRLYHHYYVKAVAGEVFTLPDTTDIIIVTSRPHHPHPFLNTLGQATC